jgi:hypothetical protein
MPIQPPERREREERARGLRTDEKESNRMALNFFEYSRNLFPIVSQFIAIIRKFVPIVC